MMAISMYLNYIAALPCEIGKFTIRQTITHTGKINLFYMKLSKVNKVQNMLISM